MKDKIIMPDSPADMYAEHMIKTFWVVNPQYDLGRGTEHYTLAKIYAEMAVAFTLDCLEYAMKSNEGEVKYYQEVKRLIRDYNG